MAFWHGFCNIIKAILPMRGLGDKERPMNRLIRIFCFAVLIINMWQINSAFAIKCPDYLPEHEDLINKIQKLTGNIVARKECGSVRDRVKALTNTEFEESRNKIIKSDIKRSENYEAFLEFEGYSNQLASNASLAIESISEREDCFETEEERVDLLASIFSIMQETTELIEPFAGPYGYTFKMASSVANIVGAIGKLTEDKDKPLALDFSRDSDKRLFIKGVCILQDIRNQVDELVHPNKRKTTLSLLIVKYLPFKIARLSHKELNPEGHEYYVHYLDQLDINEKIFELEGYINNKLTDGVDRYYLGLIDGLFGTEPLIPLIEKLRQYNKTAKDGSIDTLLAWLEEEIQKFRESSNVDDFRSFLKYFIPSIRIALKNKLEELVIEGDKIANKRLEKEMSATSKDKSGSTEQLFYMFRLFPFNPQYREMLGQNSEMLGQSLLSQMMAESDIVNDYETMDRREFIMRHGIPVYKLKWALQFYAMFKEEVPRVFEDECGDVGYSTCIMKMADYLDGVEKDSNTESILRIIAWEVAKGLDIENAVPRKLIDGEGEEYYKCEENDSSVSALGDLATLNIFKPIKETFLQGYAPLFLVWHMLESYRNFKQYAEMKTLVETKSNTLEFDDGQFLSRGNSSEKAQEFIFNGMRKDDIKQDDFPYSEYELAAASSELDEKRTVLTQAMSGTTVVSIYCNYFLKTNSMVERSTIGLKKSATQIISEALLEPFPREFITSSFEPASIANICFNRWELIDLRNLFPGKITGTKINKHTLENLKQNHKKDEIQFNAFKDWYDGITGNYNDTLRAVRDSVGGFAKLQKQMAEYRRLEELAEYYKGL